MVLLGSLCLLQLHVFTQCIPTSPGSAHSFSVEVLLMAFLGWQEGCCPFRNGWSPFSAQCRTADGPALASPATLCPFVLPVSGHWEEDFLGYFFL